MVEILNIINRKIKSIFGRHILKIRHSTYNAGATITYEAYLSYLANRWPLNLVPEENWYSIAQCIVHEKCFKNILTGAPIG